MPAMLVARLPPSRPRLSDWQRPQQPAPSLAVLFLLAVLLSSALPQSVPGYSNVDFVSQPEDVYSITGLSASFNCQAKGVAEDTETLEFLDMLVYFNDQHIDRYKTYERMSLIQENQKVAGLLIYPTELQDNNASVYCKVKDSDGEGLFTQTATLIVADGKPPPVVPTQVSQGLYDLKVMWDPVVVPMEGPVLNYTAVLEGPVQQQKEADADVTSLLFEQLIPASSYSLTVVASNQFGTGNVTSVVVTTKNPVVPSAPESVSVDVLPANSALVSWTAVVINNKTMTPVIRYNVTYFPVSNPSLLYSKSTVNANEFQMMLYNLTIGEVYTIKVSAVNSAGQGEPQNVTTTIVPVSTPSSTQATATSTTPTQLVTQSTQFSSLSSSLVPTSSGTSTLQTLSSSSTTTSVTSTSTTTATIVTSTSSSIPSMPSAIPISTSSTVATSPSFTISTSTPSSSSTNTFSTSSSSTFSTSSTNTFSTSSSATSSTGSPVISISFPSTPSTSSTGTTSQTTSFTHSTIATFATSVHSSLITYSVAALPSSSVVPPHNSYSYSTFIPLPSPSNEPDGTESTTSTGSSTTSPSGSGLLLIIVPAVIAGLVVIAIIIIAIMIIVMCVLSIRKDTTEFIDGGIPSDSPWQTQRPSIRKGKDKEHEASLKESYSGSTDRSFGSSDSSEMPTLAIHSTGSSATNGNYNGSVPDDDGTTV